MTKRQGDVLLAIRALIAERGYPPSVREVAVLVGMRSTATLHRHLCTLESEGYIARDKAISRSIRVLQKCAGDAGKESA